MSMTVVSESSMDFLVDDARTFFIEQSPFVSGLKGIQKCEFVTLDSASKVNMVEAKTSFSKPSNKDDFEKSITEIVEKFKDSLTVFNALLLRHPIEPSIQNVASVNLKNAEYEVVFVVRNLPDAGLPPVMNVLKSRMKPILKIWDIPDRSVKVFNEAKARSYGVV